jgi:hypothetical protein
LISPIATGKGLWCYSNDLGIMTSTYLHVSAATPWITEASQSLFRWQVGDVVKDVCSGRPTMSCACRKGRASVSSSILMKLHK